MNRSTPSLLVTLCLALVMGLAWGPSYPALAASPPLAAATPTVDPVDALYLLTVASYIDPLTTALKSIGELMSAPQLGSDDWKLQVAINLVAIQNVHKKLTAIEPPTRLTAVHTALLEATAQCNAATDNVANGLDDFDVDLLKLASNQMIACGEGMSNLAAQTAAALAADTATIPTAAAPTATPATSASTQTMAATRDANLRAGPGTTHKIVGTVKAGQQVKIVGKTPAGDWLQLDTQAWIAAFLVKPATAQTGVTALAAATAVPTPKPATGVTPAAPAPTATPKPAAPTATSAPAPVEGPPNAALLILANYGKQELLAIRNDGSAPLDISGWWLNGSKGDETCTIPNGITLAPGAAYQIATGESTPTAAGYICGNKTIWNNGEETIYLHMSNGETLSISADRVE